MRSVFLSGYGRIPVQKTCNLSLRKMAASAIESALADAGRPNIDALFAANMVADELENQKHLAALWATEAGLAGVEALLVRAASASGAAALRAGYTAVLSGECEAVVIVGAERMSAGETTQLLAKGLDAEREPGLTMITANATLTTRYLEKYKLDAKDLAHFAVNAHRNAMSNPDALFRKPVSLEEAAAARVIATPLRLYDCAPVCDGAAAVVLSSKRPAGRPAIRLAASAVATDVFCVADRPDPLELRASRLSAEKAYARSGIPAANIDLFEVHDAFSIMAALSLEACGFTAPGEALRFAASGAIANGGQLPLSTFGGLKARGHPVGATALYQAGEIFLQLTGRAGPNQVERAGTAMMQSIGGAGATILTQIFCAD